MAGPTRCEVQRRCKLIVRTIDFLLLTHIGCIQYTPAGNANSYLSTALNITKLDILDSFPTIKVAVGYRDPESKQEIEGFPADLKKLAELEPIYKEFQGWNKPIGQCRSFFDLPPAVSIFSL
jgi:adenylosuccinate synthase